MHKRILILKNIRALYASYSTQLLVYGVTGAALLRYVVYDRDKSTKSDYFHMKVAT